MVFLQALALGKDEMIQALGLSFTVCTFSLWIAVGWSEAVRAGLSVPGAIAVAAALAGVWAGTHLRDKVPLGTFRKMLFVMFGVLGLTMMAR